VHVENANIIAYSGEQLYVYNIETGEKILVISITGRSIEYLWSPINDRIAFLCSPDNGIHFGLYVFDPMNGLTKLDSLPCVEVNLSWSPIGEMVAYVIATKAEGHIEYSPVESEVFVINHDGTGKTQITDTPQPETLVKWQPDGRSIVVERFKNAPEPEYGGGETEVVILKLKKK
jgi:Tol biopolymer transport system component